MKQLTVGEFKSQFSRVVERVRNGEKIAVAYGKKHEIIGIFGPPETAKKKARQLGLFERRGRVKFASDFKMTEEEFLNSGKN